MSIRFNHASNKITSTSTATIIIEGGTTTQPRPLKIDASSVIFPNKQLPIGESGAVVFDINSQTLKYHNGFQWIELLSQDDILAPVQISLTDIYTQLSNRVSTVSYSSSSVPSASVSGTNLNIIFPSNSGSGGTDIPGLFTSSPPGSIMQYSLISGQTVASIREQMSGVSGGQNGRNGTSASPYITKTGWCFADGSYWTWNGDSGVVTKVVPNLNQNSYLKAITTNGITQTDSIISGSGSISNTTITEPLHYHGIGNIRGLSGEGGDDVTFISGKPFYDGNQYSGPIVTGDRQQYWTDYVNGSDSRTALSTTYDIYPNGNTSTHTHTLTSIDVPHFNVAILYNIAEPSIALNQVAGDARYVLKSGDIMTGSLTIANSAAIQADDTNLILWFRNASGGERSAIYHNTTTNTLRLRSAGGTEVTINNNGMVTMGGLTVSGQTGIVGGRNIVRSINGVTADINGNVIFSSGISDIRLGSPIFISRNAMGGYTGVTYTAPSGYVFTGIAMSWSGGDDVLEGVFIRPIQVLENGNWRTIGNV